MANRYLLVADPAEVWPPKEPEIPRAPMPDSPWTYENGSVNPDLIPSNSARLRSKSQRSKRDDMDGVYNLPPYHPDFNEDTTGTQETNHPYEDRHSDDEAEADACPNHSRMHVRRGSEGYEVRPVDRAEMLRQYMEELNAVPDRYNRYEPEPYSESEDEDDNVPLGATVRHILEDSVEV